ncbi:MAG: OadG family transporter subunit [Eubacterium sp.]|nr:OadG family transporter subunit [Eubacterium sp.]
MKTVTKKLCTVLMTVLAVCLLFTAHPVYAELDEMTKAALQQSVASFLQSAYESDDAALEQAKAQGGFYQVFADSWTEDREAVGAFKSVESVEIDDSDSDVITTTSKVQFENYDAEVIVTFDAETYQPKNYTCNVDYPLSVKLSQAGQNTAVGLLVVFVILIFLSLVIRSFGLIGKVSATPKRKIESDETEEEKIKRTAAPVKTAVKAASDDADEIAAVIAAALAAAEADSVEAGAPAGRSFYVTNVRRVKRSGGWRRV